MKLLSISFVAALAATASAQPTSPPPSGPPGEAQPVLHGVLSTATGGSVDIRGDYTYADDGDGTVLGFTAHGQYVTPQGFGGYLSIPYGAASFGDETLSGIGNLELGGLFVSHNSPTLDFYGRIGIALDTASDEGTIAVPISLLIPQAHNAFAGGIGTEWARFGGGLRTRGDVIFGVQAGFDYPLDIEGIDGILNATAAIGFRQAAFGISGGITYLQVVGDDGGDDDDFINFNGGIDFDVSPKAKAFINMGVNLDNLDEDTVISFGGGVRLGI